MISERAKRGDKAGLPLPSQDRGPLRRPPEPEAVRAAAIVRREPQGSAGHPAPRPHLPLTLHGPCHDPDPQSRLHAWSQTDKDLGAGHG